MEEVQIEKNVDNCVKCDKCDFRCKDELITLRKHWNIKHSEPVHTLGLVQFGFAFDLARKMKQNR